MLLWRTYNIHIQMWFWKRHTRVAYTIRCNNNLSRRFFIIVAHLFVRIKMSSRNKNINKFLSFYLLKSNSIIVRKIDPDFFLHIIDVDFKLDFAVFNDIDCHFLTYGKHLKLAKVTLYQRLSILLDLFNPRTCFLQLIPRIEV